MNDKMQKLLLSALVIEHDPNILHVLRHNLEGKVHKIEIAKTQEEAYSLLDKSRFDFVILNLRLSKHDPMDGADIEIGFDVLKYIRSRYTKEKLPVIVMTASGDEDTVVRALTKEEANTYIKKPFHENKEPLEDKLAGIVAFILTQREGKRRRMKSAESKSIIGKDPKLIEAIALARRVAQGDSSVVILGETGTGKELLAKEIHDSSPRRDGPFVACNCTAIPDTLFESELFGHEKGASVEEAIKKFNGKRRKELITIFARKWEDYSMAVRGWADPILRRIEYKCKNYTEEEGLSQRINNMLEDSHIPQLKNVDKLHNEATKAAQPILDLLFNPNERPVIPELSLCSSLYPAKFKKWLDDGHKIEMDMLSRIEAAFNKVAFAEQKEGKEGIGLELSYSLKTDSPKGKGMGIRDAIKRVRELFEKEELKEYLK